MDLISREEAVKAILETGELPWNRNLGYDMTFEAAAEIVESLPGVWVPMEERHPDKTGKYLVTDENGAVYPLYWEPENLGEYAELWYWDNITAWMPMPEAYHGKTAEKPKKRDNAHQKGRE